MKAGVPRRQTMLPKQMLFSTRHNYFYNSAATTLQAGQLIAIWKGFLLIVIGRDAQAGVPLAQYHLAAGAERCSVDSASALSCPLEARGESGRGGSCRTSRGI